jgi:hypothetical protein
MDIGKYDLILMIDVIEHMHKDEGTKLLQRVANNCKYFLVSTPMGYVEQDESNGNKNEKHLSGWVPEDFAGFKEYKVLGSNAQFLILLGGNL